MIISFDLDNTLIPYSDEFEVEHNLLSKLFGLELLRKGTTQLFKAIESNGHEVWIYTTSYRSIWKIKLTFALYGLFPKKIINQTINQQKLKANQCNASKNPNIFGIDVHIDDSDGVRLEGKSFGFKTIIIDTKDKEWGKKILNEI